MVYGLELFSLSKKNATKATKKINTCSALLYILYIKFETDGYNIRIYVLKAYGIKTLWYMTVLAKIRIKL